MGWSSPSPRALSLVWLRATWSPKRDTKEHKYVELLWSKQHAMEASQAKQPEQGLPGLANPCQITHKNRCVGFGFGRFCLVGRYLLANHLIGARPLQQHACALCVENCAAPKGNVLQNYAQAPRLNVRRLSSYVKPGEGKGWQSRFLFHSCARNFKLCTSLRVPPQKGSARLNDE